MSETFSLTLNEPSTTKLGSSVSVRLTGHGDITALDPDAASAHTPTPAPAAQEPAPPARPDLSQRIKAFLVTNFLLVSFVVAVTVALAWPYPGQVAGSWQVAGVKVMAAINNILVFLISGLTLKTDDLKQAVRHWVGMVYGFVSILGLTAMLAFGLIELPLTPPEFAQGLAVFATVPTTLGVGVALVGACKGNSALALLLTVGTNLLGTVTVPYLLLAVFHGGSVTVDAADLVVKMLITVLVPTAIGKTARDVSPWVAAFVSRHKSALSMFSTANLAVIVWMSLSAARDQLLQQSALSILAVIGCAAAMHLLYIILNFAAARWVLHLPPRELVSIVVMASQKSAPVAVTVITYFTNDAVVQGLMTVPCICAQVLQIFVGSIASPPVAKWVKKQDRD